MWAEAYVGVVLMLKSHDKKKLEKAHEMIAVFVAT